MIQMGPGARGRGISENDRAMQLSPNPRAQDSSPPPPHLPLIWISCPFLSHLTSASGSASSTVSRILWPLFTW